MTLALQQNCARVTQALPLPISVKQRVMSVDSFRIYSHPKLGVVIYDPVAQMGLSREQMRLFKVGSMGASTFMRGIVSKDLTECAARAAGGASRTASIAAGTSGRSISPFAATAARSVAHAAPAAAPRARASARRRSSEEAKKPLATSKRRRMRRLFSG
jgi:hypothetical protein